MEEKMEWVEIIEPKTGDHMFTNLRTGQCYWEPPQGAKIKKTHDNQWWELYDPNSRRYYYYNATTQKTVWRKPKDGDIIPLAKLQQMKVKESGKKTSADGNSKQRISNSRKDSLPKESHNDGRRSNNGDVICVSSFDTESDTSERNSEISARRLQQDLELALRVSTMTAGSNGKVSESDPRQKGIMIRSSSTGDAESENGQQKRAPRIDKLRSQTVKGQGNSPKLGRTPPPKPPRVQPPISMESTVGNSESNESNPPKVPKLPMMANVERKESLKDGQSNNEGQIVLRKTPTFDDSFDDGNSKDEADFVMLSGRKPQSRSKSVKPSRPPPMAPTTPVSPDNTEHTKSYKVPLPPPVPPVKVKKETRRQLPKLNVAKANPDDDEEEEEEDKPEDDDGGKSPFTRMIEEMEAYNGNLSSPTEHPVAKKSKGLEPSTSFDDPNSPSGTLLPAQKSEKFSHIGNGTGKQHETNEIPREGSDGSFAERLNSMGMPLNTAALVDACDPSSDPGTPKTESRLARMHSDTTIVVRKSPTPQDGDKSTTAHRPMSMMPAPGKSREPQSGGHRNAFNANAPETAELTREVPLSKHRKGFLRKRMSIASMLSWSKVPIKKPMVMTRDKQLRKDAIDVFKLTLQYMGDRGSRKSPPSIALDIVSKGWSTKGLRDEIYIQLCKQTTGNEKTASLTKGWELITMCLSLFPPSNKFHSYLEGYIYRHLEPDMDTAGVPVSTYAKHCYKQLERICQTGAKRGLKRPTLEEIEQAKQSVFYPSMFGNTLEDIMELQEDYYKSRKLPWIMTTLAELVLANNGLRTEGIFRVPGDIDEVNSLKVLIDKWKSPDSVKDPHIPGSLLKLWFRDLYEPLIPNVFYERCIRNCDNSTVALSIVYSLPELNSIVFCYLIRFLQAFMLPEIAAVTKMDENNLAMVWAPNCLRCPSDDPMQIFENTRKEMTFLRTLMQNLDTSFLEGVI